jgi:hypothetical protein
MYYEIIFTVKSLFKVTALELLKIKQCFILLCKALNRVRKNEVPVYILHVSGTM